jgi:hypothetical protein
MGGDVVYITLEQFGSGFVPNCYFSYTETVSTKNGSTISGHWSVRVWVCGSYKGDYGTNIAISGNNQTYGTPLSTMGAAASRPTTTTYILRLMEVPTLYVMSAKVT